MAQMDPAASAAPQPDQSEGGEAGSASQLLQDIHSSLMALQDMLSKGGASDQESQDLQGITGAFEQFASQLAGAPQQSPQGPKTVSMEGGVGGVPMQQQG